MVRVASFSSKDQNSRDFSIQCRTNYPKTILQYSDIKPHPNYFQFSYHSSETWSKEDIVENANGTLSFNAKRVYVFSEEESVGSEDDVVIVPNIPMLSATSQSKHAAR